jgi:hypothetical protein
MAKNFQLYLPLYVQYCRANQLLATRICTSISDICNKREPQYGSHNLQWGKLVLCHAREYIGTAPQTQFIEILHAVLVLIIHEVNFPQTKQCACNRQIIEVNKST